MKPFVMLLLIFVFANSNSVNLEKNYEKNKMVLVVHGGAGAILKENMTMEREAAYRKKIEEALSAGHEVLNKGGSAVDAVETAMVILEDSPLFNAGKGAVFTADGIHELDASIMDGKSLNAGAVAVVKTIKNPIKAARLVMDKSPHVMLIGEGADAFAAENQLETVDSVYFHDDYRFQQWKKMRDGQKPKLDHSDDKGETPVELKDEKFGTVGAVALDVHGNLAAATSTGGMTNKQYGRVGDSPIIGAGTYADNNSCAVSCTGHGEYFIRTVAAKNVAMRVALKNETVTEAAQKTLDEIKSLGGDGGMIVLDAQGNIAMPFTTLAMFRGYVKNDGKVFVEIF